MQFRILSTVVGFVAFMPLTRANATPAAPFELRDGDRVVLLGDTLIEREQHFGFLELAMTTRFPDRNVTFRNIGWSADTPAGDSRFGLSLLQAGGEPADEAWKQLCEQLKQLRPTVVVLGYGMANSFSGEAGLPRFVADMERLMDTIQSQAAPSAVRFVILSPIPHLREAAPLPDPIEHNHIIVKYVAALRTIAAKREAPFVSFDALADRPALSANGIHLNAAGYRAAAELLESELGWPVGPWRDLPKSEPLRQAILKKNELFFHRSRPANMAYIFGFRKREQGQNAVEIPQFDPLIAAEDQVIAKLRALKPVDLPPEPPARTMAVAAKFTPQPHPAFQVADGFEVNLWAENPMLAKPIQMNFDPRGRLWVASSEVYPQIEPGQTPNDKIIVLEDTTGGGKADKAIVFADGLLIPTGLEPGDGGVYVAQSTELLHLSASRPEGRADARRTVLSGFGTEDTHHNLHTLRWGPDGRLYMNQSVYTRTDTETPRGVVRLKGGGVFRFDPRAGQMDVLLRGWVNAWGHQFDPFGQSFITDGAGGDGISYGLPGASYTWAVRARRLLGSVSPGNYPKFSSLEIIQSRHFPADWQGDHVTCDFRANKVVRFKMEDEGAGYIARQSTDLLRSTDVNFRPIDVKLGPDGALYIADWSNPIINHGEVDFRDPRRDHWHGRIWRVTAKGRPLNPRHDLVDAPTPALLDSLLSPNSFDRAQARRVLIERGSGILNDLAAWTPSHPTDEARLQALWLHEALHSVNATLLHQVLTAGDGRIRAAAVRVLNDSIDQFPNAQQMLTERVADDHPRVRLEAVRALARIPTAAAADIALRAFDKPMDRFLDYALWLTVNDLAEPLLAALQSGTNLDDDRKLEFVLKSVEGAKATAVLGKLLDRRPLTREGRGPWIELIGRSGTPTDLRRLYDQTIASGFDDTATVRALAAMGESARLRQIRPSGDITTLAKLLDHAPEPVRLAAVRLAGGWHLAEVAPRILRLATDRANPPAERIAAIDALRDLGGPETVAGLRKLADASDEAVATRRQAALALLAVSPVDAYSPLRALLSEPIAERDAGSLWRSILGAGATSNRFAGYLRDQPLPPAAAAAGLRVARETQGRHQNLVLVLSRQSGDTTPRQYAPGDIERMAAHAKLDGNADRGEMVYRRPELRCVACHAIGGAGGKVGPDLTSVGAAAPMDYLVESVYLPDKAIKEGFHSLQIEQIDGKVTTGILVRETGQEIILRDADGKEIAIPRTNVQSRTMGGSLMPLGLIDHLFDNEQRDLFRFLSELGKPGPFDAARNQAAKSWRVVAANAATAEQAQRGDDALAGWTPLTTTVAGALLKSEVRAIPGVKGTPIYAATRFEVPKAGPVSFKFGKEAPAAMWIDGKATASTADQPITLAAGVHSLVVRIDPARMPEKLTLRSPDVVFRPD
jgi:putative heme-binding domain-containing protein